MNTLILIDDHDMMRRGLVSYFNGKKNWKVLGQAGSAEEAIALFDRLKNSSMIPDITLLDIDLNGSWGLDLAAVIKKEFDSKSRIIVYSVFEDFAHIMAAIRAGAAGYVCKAQRETELEAAMKTVLDGGGFFIPGNLAAKLPEVFDRTAGLTRREKEIFNMIQMRKSNREIAAGLDITLRTVENNLSLIYDIMGVKLRKELEKL
jgi:DNA-binding NarL/FixJ family response regulator